MPITPRGYTEAVEALAELTPFVRVPGPNALAILWATIPEQVRQELTPAHLAYAVQQYLQDPARPEGLPTHLALLRYLYRLENGLPNFRWGLRQDLAERMAAVDFQPLPASEADLACQHRLPNHDGARHEPRGLLAHLKLLPSPCGPAVAANGAPSDGTADL